jgi:PAS domain S-box-containing protein
MTERFISTLPVATEAEQFRLLVDSVREYAIYLLDANGIVRSWNTGAQRIKGYSAKEIIGQHFSRMFTDEDRTNGRPARIMAEAARNDSCRDEGWRVRKDGTRFWASVVVNAVRDELGELRGFTKVSRDETERHAIEEQVRHNAQELERLVESRTQQLMEKAENLRRANEELEQFNYVTSHDLQEPLRMVGIYMQKLARQADGKLSDDEKRYVRYAIEGAERMRLLIDDLLRYNRLDRERAEHEPIPSGDALRAALDNLAQLITENAAEVVSEPLPLVRANLGQLTQVFQNLIHNAVKYKSDQPPRIHIDAVASGRAWKFRMRDNGIGIEPQYHDRIFEVFQRLHSREYPGTGMGLAICKKIVEQHGGRIWVESSRGSGSAFHFTLPAL